MKKLSFSLFLIILASFFSSNVNGEITINRYTSLNGWGVNSYWIETDKNLVLIDAQLLKSDAKHLANSMKAVGKPLKAVFITHAHADHFSGLAVLKDILGNFEVIGTQLTKDGLEPKHYEFLKGGFSRQFGDNVIRRFIPINRVAKDKEVFHFDDLEIKVHELGAGEAESQMVVAIPSKKVLFTGDATMHNSHYYVGEGRSAEAMKSFKRLQNEFSGYHFYTGHGEPAPAAIVDGHLEYVNYLRELVGNAIKSNENLVSGKKQLKKEVREALALKVKTKYPYYFSYGYEALDVIQWSLWGVERELLSLIN